MSELVVDIPGEPVAKGRPKIGMNRATGHVLVRTPEKTVNFEALVKHEASHAMKHHGLALLQGPVAMEIDSFWSPLKKAPFEATPKTSRPDADNAAKAICDAMNGIVFKDDAQVVDLTVRKWRAGRGEAPRTQVKVTSLDGEWPS